MSDTIWLEVTDGSETTGGDSDYSAMFKFGEKLDSLAVGLGVPKPSSFYDSSALAEAYAAEIEDADIAPVEPEWFDAGAGRRALEAILGSLRENPAAVQTPPILLDELQECHASLVEAEQRGLRFHFLIVP